MTIIVDISVPLHAGIPIWPDSVGVKLASTKSLLNGDAATVSRLEMDVHAGTHIDAPAHTIADGSTVDATALEDLIGPAWVVHLLDLDAVSAAALETADIPMGTRRLLLRTRNSELWKTSKFHSDYVALTHDAARWIVNRGIRLVGCDYLSVQRFVDTPATHLELLGAGLVVLEGLNLEHVAPGEWELLCLPLRLVGSEGAPARAVLRREATP